MISTITDIERRTVPEPNTGCWLWTGARDQDGYGRFRVSKTRYEKAHPRHFDLSTENFEDCNAFRDTPSCVNPHHLKYGTQTDNVRDIWTGASEHYHWRTCRNVETTRAAVIDMRRRRGGETLSAIGAAHGVSLSTART